MVIWPALIIIGNSMFGKAFCNVNWSSCLQIEQLIFICFAIWDFLAQEGFIR